MGDLNEVRDDPYGERKSTYKTSCIQWQELISDSGAGLSLGAMVTWVIRL